MPSKSKPQARMMAAAAHNPAFAKKVGVPVKVAKDFNKADAGIGILKGSKSQKPDKKKTKDVSTDRGTFKMKGGD